MPVPTARFAVVVALPSIAFFFISIDDWTALWIVEGALLLAFVLDASFGVSPSRIAVERHHVDDIRLGDTTTLTWVLENSSGHAAQVRMTDSLWPSLRASRRIVTVNLDARARHVATTELWPSRRGRFPLQSITVRVSSPLKLATRHRTRDVPTVLRVMPAYPSRGEIQRRMRQPRIIDVGIRTLRLKGASTDFDQLREFRPGDDSRRIDWAATARTQRPIVRQYRAERNQTIVLMLDNGRIMAGRVGAPETAVPRVEHGMDAALGVTQLATRLGDNVGLVTFDRQVRTVVAPAQSRVQTSRIAEAMYLLEPELSESSYGAAFTYATSRFRRRSLYILLTDLAESVVDESILPALPILSRRHLVVVAAVSDPEVQRWATGDEQLAASDAFRQAAAISTMQQRRRSSARLTAAGAVVVDAEPGTLAIRLVDTYLELKASGRL